MVICLSVNEADARAQEEQASGLAKAREGAELLAEYEDGRRSFWCIPHTDIAAYVGIHFYKWHYLYVIDFTYITVLPYLKGGLDDSENYYVQIADQSGKPLDMPTGERKVPLCCPHIR